MVTKQRFTPIAAVVAMNLKENEDQTKENVVETDINELAAEYRCAYLIISNRHDVRAKLYPFMSEDDESKFSTEQPNKNWGCAIVIRR